MNRLILCFAIGFLSFGTTDAAAQQPSGARLQVETPMHNFGDVSRRGGDLVREFVIKNQGDAPLVVLRVITSCSCLNASFSKRPVMPGERDTITITYEPHKSEPGAFNKVIRILSNSRTGEEVICVQGFSFEGERNRTLRRLERVQVKERKEKNKEE